MFESRNYMIFNVSEVDSINFNEVMETSADTLRKSVDGSKTFVKWDGTMPPCVDSLTTKEGPYSHSQILSILSGAEWAKELEQDI